MATDSTCRPGLPAAERALLARGACLAAVLLAELTVLCFHFNTIAMEGEPEWWARLLRLAPLVRRLSIPMAAAGIFLGGAWFRTEFRRPSGPIAAPSRWWLFALAHLLAFACFAWVTAFALGGEIHSSPVPGAWAVAWFLTGLLALALWAAALLPPLIWLRFTRARAAVLLAAVAVGVAAWGAGQVTVEMWQPASRATLWTVGSLLGLVCPDVVYQPADLVVGTPSFAVEVGAPCSGFEGVGLGLVFFGVYLWLFRRDLRFPRALLLLPLGAAAMWLANAARITALVAIGSWVSPAVAMGGFHTQAGWLTLNAVALGLVAATRRRRWFATDDPTSPASAVPNPAAAYLLPLFAVVAAAMIARAFSADFDRLYPLRVLAGAAALWFCWRGRVAWPRAWPWEAVLLGVAAFALWVAFPGPDTSADGAALAAGLEGLPRAWAGAWLGFRILGSVVTVPLVEELAFRGYLTRRLIAADFQEVPPGRFSWFSFLASSALFGALHGRWLAGTLAGMLYALALYRRKSLADAVVAHATTNALLGASVLATGSWSWWC